MFGRLVCDWASLGAAATTAPASAAVTNSRRLSGMARMVVSQGLKGNKQGQEARSWWWFVWVRGLSSVGTKRTTK